MQYSVIALALAALVAATPKPQSDRVTALISPSGAPPPGCTGTYQSKFYISTVNATTSSEKKMVKRQSPNLSITLKDGVLKDQDGNKGYIAANNQFQFANNGPEPQTGAIYTAGFSICANKTLALGSTTIFQSCNSGSFNNLYYGNDAAQCSNVFISAIDTGDSSGSTGGSASSGSSASAAPDNQAQGPTSAGPAVTQTSDNQPQAPTAASSPVTQISDNQPQAPTAASNATATFAPTSYTGAAAIATAAPMAMAAAGALLAFL